MRTAKNVYCFYCPFLLIEKDEKIKAVRNELKTNSLT